MGAGKIYLQPMEMVYNAVLDLMELQNGKQIINDPVSGKLSYMIKMYGFTWELRFALLGMEHNRCGVNLEITEAENVGDNEQGYGESMIRREYALLDAMLLFGSPPKVTYNKEAVRNDRR